MLLAISSRGDTSVSNNLDLFQNNVISRITFSKLGTDFTSPVIVYRCLLRSLIQELLLQLLQ